ncbi:hypothetical protein B0H17DRAFT_1337152 [Mycena rosella]|uniref:Eukaryotic translation initiation factor 3 subunit A n=1 Tax=Mycena rosella TaxID=1033263 RepID=A0AAD7CSC4_MYCRO|nr:hypothetical protein B0H17DRAFT_1337152 [Mycena rosella]
MAPFSKPETVLKQAEGLVSVGQTHAALQSLTEMFSSKRFRSTPLASLEPIMHRFVELCVDMRKGRTAKEGLMQYKNIAQNTSVQSIEAVITRFVQLADQKVREAQEKAAVKVAVDVEDLEASETPESILLGAVSGDQSKDRTDRALVTPWLKFLWESYRTSLETLKNNARLEVIYQTIAQQAFKFCLKHQRKVEFRRLCETLRLHLSNVAKYSHQPHSINLADPDTLQHHLDTRFAQLTASVELELWQEAFRSVEDVHNLLTMAKKAPRPAMMATYYEQLTKIFLMSGNALYHAAAWAETAAAAGHVLISALAVPVGQTPADSARLTALLNLPRPPTRASLLSDALARGVLALAPPTIARLYSALEASFDPLALCGAVAPILAELRGGEYAEYVPLLQRAVLSRLLAQLAQVYASVRIAFVLELVAPLVEPETEGTAPTEGEPEAPSKSPFSPPQIESYIMSCARRGELAVRVDHAAGSIAFLDDAFADLEGPRARRCGRGAGERRGGGAHAGWARGARARKAADVAGLAAQVQTERKALALRRALVARRRELLAELGARREKEEAARRAEAGRREREDEAKRAKEEARRKEIARVQKIQEDMKMQDAERYKAALVEKGILKAGDRENIASLDTEGLIGMQVAQLEKEKKELAERLRIVAKRVDHIERARRPETFTAVQTARATAARTAHETDLETKARLARMLPAYEARRGVVLARKGEEYAKKKDAAARKVEEEKAKRRKAIMAERDAEKRAIEEAERREREREAEVLRLEEERAAEEERLRAEEEEKVAAAEAAKREVEEKALAVRKQREAERAEAMEKARLQQQREEEAEARARAAKNAPAARKPLVVAAPSATRASPAAAAATGDGGVWRRAPPSAPSVPTTPTRAGGLGGAPARAESPSPAVGKYVPGALRGGAPGGGGGWRERQEAAARAAAAAPAPARVASPAPAPPASPAPAKDDAPKDDDGFQTVPEKKGVWRPRRGRA